MAQELKKIKSFSINHDILQKGFYVSRVDGDVITYDIRMVIPNKAPIWTMRGFTHLSTFLPPMSETAPIPTVSSMWAPWAAGPDSTI